MFDHLRGALNVYRGWRGLGSGLGESIGAAAGFYRASRQQ